MSPEASRRPSLAFSRLGRPATINDVADAAGVSPATVSRVLNGTQGVTPARSERVRTAVAELGYQPFSAARALRRQRTDVWAVIVADVENPFFTSVVRGVEDAARAIGVRVVLCNSDEDPDRETEYIDVAIAERMDGVVIAAAASRHSHVQRLLDRGVAVVAIDRTPTGAEVDAVLVDNRLGAEQATRHLAAVGATRIACITGPRRTQTAEERLAGYRAGLVHAGLAFDADLVVHTDFRQAGGYDATIKLCQGRDRPDALFVANNLMTLGALGAIRDLGLTVPNDLAVVGFDDAPWATLVDPQLSVVAQPTREIGRVAAELLVARRADPDAPINHVVLAPDLVIRQSSARR